MIGGRPGGASALIIVLTGILLAVGFYFFPLISDDISFRMPFREYFVEGGSLPSLAALLDYCRHIHSTVNSRLANFLMIFIQFWPRWLLVVCSAIAACVSIAGSLRLIGASLSRFSAAILSALFVFILPWVDQLYVFNFQINYLWGGALWVVFACAFLSRRCNPWLLALIGLVLGAWQECCSLPALVAVVALAVIYPAFRDRRSLFSALSLLIGLAWLYFSPGGTLYRSSEPLFAGRLIIVLIMMLPALIFLLWLAAQSVRRRRLPSAPMVFIAVSCLISLAIAMLTEMGPRVGWIASLTASAGLTSLISQSLTRCRRAFAIAALVLLSVHLIVVDCYSWRIGRCYDRVIADFIARPDDMQFAPLTLRSDLPLICLQKPYADIFSHQRQVMLLSDFYFPRRSWIRVVPDSLRDFTPAASSPLPGSDSFFLSHGLIVGPATTGIYPIITTLMINYGSGDLPVICYVIPFRAADGQLYCWYYPSSSSVSQILHKKPQSVKK